LGKRFSKSQKRGNNSVCCGVTSMKTMSRLKHIYTSLQKNMQKIHLNPWVNAEELSLVTRFGRTNRWTDQPSAQRLTPIYPTSHFVCRGINIMHHNFNCYLPMALTKFVPSSSGSLLSELELLSKLSELELLSQL